MDDVKVDREARIRRALQHLRDDTTDQLEAMVPFRATEFTDPNLAERERDLVFGRVPTIVAHGSEIAAMYDFKTLQMPRNKIIVVRQRDGGVKSFVNLCRHRGALLEESESGRCRLFSCPYHRWSYDIDGTLRTVTRANTVGDIDTSQYGLVELPTEERHGFVWVVDDADATIDVADWLGPMDAILGGYGLEGLQCVQAEGFTEAVNWKVMQDAFLDGYHIQYAHPNTAAKHIHTNVMAFEDMGRHCRFVAPRKTIDRFLEEEPGEGDDLGDYVTETHFLGPNSTLLRQPDHFELLTFRPHDSDPQLSVMEMRLIVPSAEAMGLDQEKWQRRWDKNWQILLSVLHEEDFPVLRSSQRGMNSRSAGSMMLGRNEVANQVFRRMLGALLDESPRT